MCAWLTLPGLCRGAVASNKSISHDSVVIVIIISVVIIVVIMVINSNRMGNSNSNSISISISNSNKNRMSKGNTTRVIVKMFQDVVCGRDDRRKRGSALGRSGNIDT